MSTKDLKAAYRTIMDDHFPAGMEISFVGDSGRQTLAYEKVSWLIDGVRKGLRYGENPGQEAAMYRLVGGNLKLGEVESIAPGHALASDIELLQSGKHPGKINITDADSALNILKFLTAKPCTVIVKHNNPCGVAVADRLVDSYERANMADRVAAFGGAIAVNRALDIATAEKIVENYAEVVVAPEFEEGVFDRLSAKKNLRVMRIGNMARLQDFATRRMVEFKSLIDGGLIVQWSFVPEARSKEALTPARTVHRDKEYAIARLPSPEECEDMVFGWLVEAGVTSNSVIYVKDGVTVGIGTGEQDRVGVAEIARDKAYRKMADRICWQRHGVPYNDLRDTDAREAIDRETRERKGGLVGSCMISDAFFPFRDGVDVGLREGVTAVLQPGGSLRDFEVIEACNEAGATMAFTGQRSFRH